MKKPITGWAITNPNGSIVTIDSQYPIFYRRYVARRVALEYGLMKSVLRKVTLTMAKR